MKQNKIKKSSNFAFWLGFGPILFFVLSILGMSLVVVLHNDNNPVVAETIPEVKHDTIYVECHKKHCEDLVIPTPPLKKKKAEEKRTDTVPTSVPKEVENVEPIESND